MLAVVLQHSQNRIMFLGILTKNVRVKARTEVFFLFMKNDMYLLIYKICIQLWPFISIQMVISTYPRENLHFQRLLTCGKKKNDLYLVPQQISCFRKGILLQTIIYSIPFVL